MCDIYNCNKTSIFFKVLPNKSLLGPNEAPAGLKVQKDRFSLLEPANAIGEKEKLLVIGKAKCSHSFPKYNTGLECVVSQHINDPIER